MNYLVDVAAAARLTRLATRDTFPPVKRLREWALDKVDPKGVRHVEGAEPPALAELVECSWCAGVYVSAGVVVVRALAPKLWDPLSRVLAMSMAVGLAAGWSEQEGDIKDMTKCLGVGVGELADAIRGRSGNGNG